MQGPPGVLSGNLERLLEGMFTISQEVTKI